MINCHNYNINFSNYFISIPEEELDQFNIHVSRYRPEELTKLIKTTKFTRKEIQLIYRGFKQVRTGRLIKIINNLDIKFLNINYFITEILPILIMDYISCSNNVFCYIMQCFYCCFFL